MVEFRAAFERACGVVRHSDSLEPFLEDLAAQPDTTEKRLAERVARACLERTENIGAHFRADAGLNDETDKLDAVG